MLCDNVKAILSKKTVYLSVMKVMRWGFTSIKSGSVVFTMLDNISNKKINFNSPSSIIAKKFYLVYTEKYKVAKAMLKSVVTLSYCKADNKVESIQ